MPLLQLWISRYCWEKYHRGIHRLIFCDLLTILYLWWVQFELLLAHRWISTACKSCWMRISMMMNIKIGSILPDSISLYESVDYLAELLKLSASRSTLLRWCGEFIFCIFFGGESASLFALLLCDFDNTIALHSRPDATHPEKGYKIARPICMIPKRLPTFQWLVRLIICRAFVQRWLQMWRYGGHTWSVALFTYDLRVAEISALLRTRWTCLHINGCVITREWAILINVFVTHALLFT